MKLLHSGARARALVSASRALRTYEGSQYSYTQLCQFSACNSLSQSQCHLRRTLTTKTTPQSPSPSPSSTTNTINSATEAETPEPLHVSTQIRLLMRRVPYPVAIITSTDPNPSPTQSHTKPNSTPSTRYRGMTVSSFNTVTLTPEPVISFNVRRPSETLHALLASRRFLVHLLKTDKGAADLARDFAMGNHRLARNEGGESGEGMSGFEFVGVRPFEEGQGQVEGTADEKSQLALPMLRWRGKDTASEAKQEAVSSFFPFIFECRLLPDSVTEVYDHTIVVGRIVRAITSGDPASEISSKDLCLTYANAKFYEVGEEVV
ncbi:flavin reductase like domain-containing protein [Aspergillus oleicola]